MRRNGNKGVILTLNKYRAYIPSKRMIFVHCVDALSTFRQNELRKSQGKMFLG